MHITIDSPAGVAMVGSGRFAVSDLMANAAVAAAWRDFSAFRLVDISDDASARGVEHGASVPLLIGDLGALQQAILSHPLVTAWLAGVAARAAATYAANVRGECSRRIYAVMSDSTQKNLSAYAADLAITAVTGTAMTTGQQADMTVARAARVWVLAMVAQCRQFIVTPDDYLSDGGWPPLPGGVTELAGRF